jgi:SAM-dependent methyltransferase
MSWFEDWFNTPYYHILYKDRDYKEAENFISNLTKELKLPTHSSIIDLACGKGRHSVFLNQLGFEVLGVDLSEESILHNKQFENSASPKLEFKVHDMRNELYPEISEEKVNAVFNLFTSFGYFDDEEDDRKVFQSVKNVLKEGGIFILDFLNEGFVKNTLIAETTINKGILISKLKKELKIIMLLKTSIFKTKDKIFIILKSKTEYFRTN